MKKQTNLISQNLTALRQYHKYSQEEVAEKVGVTRQAVAKWEAGETVPDIINCDALADLYDVSVDALIHHDQKESFSFGYNGIPCKLDSPIHIHQFLNQNLNTVFRLYHKDTSLLHDPI